MKEIKMCRKIKTKKSKKRLRFVLTQIYATKSLFLQRLFLLSKTQYTVLFDKNITAYRYDIFREMKLRHFKSFFKIKHFCCRAVRRTPRMSF